MPQPFITAVLDMLKPGKVSIDDACHILSDAIAPEVGMGAPSGALRGINSQFKALLGAYLTDDADRRTTEDSITRIFALAARRDFKALAEWQGMPESAGSD